MTDLRFRIEDWWYGVRHNDWRCTIGVHRSEFWADYNTSLVEPPEAYWHCAICGHDCYPLRIRISLSWWESRLAEKYIAWRYRDD